ncbi:hypothetical protein JOE51_008779 [Bradyrhizobium japonicum]|nr:hypothetical protein [Bradyrhizobium japonicum]
MLGEAVLAKMRVCGEQLMHARKSGLWFYSDHRWELQTSCRWLEVRVAEACEGLGFTVNNRLVNETRRWIEYRPELWRDDDIPWDQHGKIPTRSGLIDPITGELEPARPDHYCTWRVEVDYDRGAKCPWWETMIADVFGDKSNDEQRELVRVVQECFGAALIDKKPRGLAKACVFWGNENRAKSGVLDVVAGLLGRPISASISSIDGNHGLMPFVRRAPWVLHEAFNPGQWHISSSVKAIVTGEPVQINIKNGPMLSQVVRAPIFWATNGQPQFKESTRAIVSRLIVIETTRKFDVAKPIGAAAEAKRRGFSKPGEFVVATELPGVLNWAIAGLKRAIKRGFIETTNSIEATAKAIHNDSNLVAGFLEDCVEFDPNARLRIADFCLAHSAWWLELKGESRKLPSNSAINKALKALGEARICTDRDDDLRDKSGRYYAGMKLNKAGLRYHSMAYESRIFEGKTMTATTPTGEVNSHVPATWDQKEAVIKMRAAFERVTGTMTDAVTSSEMTSLSVTSSS